ncbi:hypothetical protein H696_01640 [Fonticula alba]|uniref:Uncharacterized protein n=1 Tax=Fonticula alba TaxID=691883 RepID=A0A058ZCV2_FONAL|nr:hypothetical protein H696_01640 [Fonticula alba]KCV72240.1 hypothetical protein H696_01640 [Fonticula alba]|eukprot:XP_009493818.1 hypothetical protein H696_01640 [Fonticula alba]
MPAPGHAQGARPIVAFLVLFTAAVAAVASSTHSRSLAAEHMMGPAAATTATAAALVPGARLAAPEGVCPAAKAEALLADQWWCPAAAPVVLSHAGPHSHGPHPDEVPWPMVDHQRWRAAMHTSLQAFLADRLAGTPASERLRRLRIEDVDFAEQPAEAQDSRCRALFAAQADLADRCERLSQLLLQQVRLLGPAEGALGALPEMFLPSAADGLVVLLREGLGTLLRGGPDAGAGPGPGRAAGHGDVPLEQPDLAMAATPVMPGSPAAAAAAAAAVSPIGDLFGSEAECPIARAAHAGPGRHYFGPPDNVCMPAGGPGSPAASAAPAAAAPRDPFLHSAWRSSGRSQFRPFLHDGLQVLDTEARRLLFRLAPADGILLPLRRAPEMYSPLRRAVRTRGSAAGQGAASLVRLIRPAPGARPQDDAQQPGACHPPAAGPRHAHGHQGWTPVHPLMAAAPPTTPADSPACVQPPASGDPPRPRTRLAVARPTWLGTALSLPLTEAEIAEAESSFTIRLVRRLVDLALGRLRRPLSAEGVLLVPPSGGRLQPARLLASAVGRPSGDHRIEEMLAPARAPAKGRGAVPPAGALAVPFRPRAKHVASGSPAPASAAGPHPRHGRPGARGQPIPRTGASPTIATAAALPANVNPLPASLLHWFERRSLELDQIFPPAPPAAAEAFLRLAPLHYGWDRSDSQFVDAGVFSVEARPLGFHSLSSHTSFPAVSKQRVYGSPASRPGGPPAQGPNAGARAPVVAGHLDAGPSGGSACQVAMCPWPPGPALDRTCSASDRCSGGPPAVQSSKPVPGGPGSNSTPRQPSPWPTGDTGHSGGAGDPSTGPVPHGRPLDGLPAAQRRVLQLVSGVGAQAWNTYGRRYLGMEVVLLRQWDPSAVLLWLIIIASAGWLVAVASAWCAAGDALLAPFAGVPSHGAPALDSDRRRFAASLRPFGAGLMPLGVARDLALAGMESQFAAHLREEEERRLGAVRRAFLRPAVAASPADGEPAVRLPGPGGPGQLAASAALDSPPCSPLAVSDGLLAAAPGRAGRLSISLPSAGQPEGGARRQDDADGSDVAPFMSNDVSSTLDAMSPQLATPCLGACIADVLCQ